MACRAPVHRATMTVALSCVLAVGSLATIGMSWPEPMTHTISCFTVGGKVACVSTGQIPVAPMPPMMIAPSGQDVEGEDVDVEIRDDGGRHVSRG